MTTPQQFGIALGTLLGFWHLVWSVLVAMQLAQPLMDLVFSLHMIQPPYTVMPFSLGMAVGLVIFTTVFGYVIGFGLGIIWKTLHAGKK